MLQTKFISGDDMAELEKNLNDALREIDGEPNVRYFENSWIAVIETKIIPEYEGRLCCDCQFWDDVGNQSLSNFCTITGKRTRFNCQACRQFKDLRG